MQADTNPLFIAMTAEKRQIAQTRLFNSISSWSVFYLPVDHILHSYSF